MPRAPFGLQGKMHGHTLGYREYGFILGIELREMFYKQDDKGFRPAFDAVDFKTLVHGERTSLGLFRLDKGAVIPVHSHPHEQTGYLLKGRMTFMIDGVDHEAVAGDSWSIPGNVEHAVRAHEDCEVIEVFSPVREEYLP